MHAFQNSVEKKVSVSDIVYYEIVTDNKCIPLIQLHTVSVSND